jgi:DNA-binding response OmpR family regulator
MHVLVVISQPDDEPRLTAGWQKAFVLTRENAADFANFVATQEPDLMLLDAGTGRRRMVRGAEWLRQRSEQPLGLADPLPGPSTELVIGPARIGRWSLSPEQRQVFRPDGRSCGLTSAEYHVLVLLLRRGHKPASRTEISLPVLGRPHRDGDRAVDILVHKLRSKLGPGAIVTIRGAGYAFAALPDAGHLPPPVTSSTP